MFQSQEMLIQSQRTLIFKGIATEHKTIKICSKLNLEAFENNDDVKICCKLNDGVIE